MGLLDIKLKSSRKPGAIVTIIFLAVCSFLMLNNYGNIRKYLESESDMDSRRQEALFMMGKDLCDGNYILYNEYSEETELSEVLDEYGLDGDRNFDLQGNIWPVEYLTVREILCLMRQQSRRPRGFRIQSRMRSGHYSDFQMRESSRISR